MSHPTIAEKELTTDQQISPDYVRLSMAATIELGLARGRLYRDAHCTCINLLHNYPQGCYANCVYCGLARERPGVAEDNSFIRVAWPLHNINTVVERIAAKEAEGRIGRVCISQVQDHRTNDDLLTHIAQVRAAAPDVPVSALVNATSLDEEWLERIKAAGADIVGFGLDAVTPELFYNTRGRGVRSPHTWDYHWRMIRAARRIFGPMNVNCHVIVGLGETDRELIEMFYQLKSEQIAAYLFSFNAEPGTAMQHVPRQPLHRWRRIQLVKYLVEKYDLPRDALTFDADGALVNLQADPDIVAEAINSGLPFMTNGCPDRHGDLACNRPYGSYRPGEEFRDYPFLPTADDLRDIWQQLRLAEIMPDGIEA